MSMNFLRIPTMGIAMLGRLGVEQFWDVSDWSENAPHPRGDAELTPPPTSRYASSATIECDDVLGGEDLVAERSEDRNL